MYRIGDIDELSADAQPTHDGPTLDVGRASADSSPHMIHDRSFLMFPSRSFGIMSFVMPADAYTTQEVDYGWRKTKQNRGKGIEIVSDEMAQFEMKGVYTSTKAATNSKGTELVLCI